MTHICVSKLTIIGSDNGLSPGRRQAIIRTNAGILLIGPLGTNFNEILIGIQTFSFKKMHLKMSFAKWRPFSLGHNELMQHMEAAHWNHEMSWCPICHHWWHWRFVMMTTSSAPLLTKLVSWQHFGFNSFDARGGIFWLIWPIPMPADALAPYVTRASAGMVLTV